MDQEFDETEHGGQADRVSPWYVSQGRDTRARSSGWVGSGNRYRVSVPGVDYVGAWRDARIAELLLVELCERHLGPLGLGVTTDQLVTMDGAGVVRCEIPAAGILVLAELVRDGERFRDSLC